MGKANGWRRIMPFFSRANEQGVQTYTHDIVKSVQLSRLSLQKAAIWPPFATTRALFRPGQSADSPVNEVDSASRFADILDLVQDLLHGVFLLVLLRHVPLQEIGRRVILLFEGQAHQRVDLAGDGLLVLEDLLE